MSITKEVVHAPKVTWIDHNKASAVPTTDCLPKSIYQDQPDKTEVQIPMASNCVDNTQITEDIQSLSSVRSTRSPPKPTRLGSQPRVTRARVSSSGQSVSSEPSVAKKKDKKLVFLSRSVLQSVRESPMTTGTEIAY